MIDNIDDTHSFTIHHMLDIRQDVCPLTFVKAKLLMDRMQPGETAEILLKGQEVLDNLPLTVTEHHNTIISLDQRINNNQTSNNDDYYYILVFQKQGHDGDR